VGYRGRAIDANLTLDGGALAENVFWHVAATVTLGTASVFHGTILGQTAIVMNTGSSLNGLALAQSAITLDAATVVKPPF
jgi:hypothetical protein